MKDVLNHKIQINDFKLSVFVATAVLLFASSPAMAQDPAPAKPNIVLFFVDDMGWNDTSVPFHNQQTVWNDLYQTPNMQRLANQGVRFTNAYAASPVCSPTRTSIMTGKNPGRTRVSDWVRQNGARTGGGGDNSFVRAPNWQASGLQPNNHTTLPSVLKANGYLTAHVGKAHFGARNTAGANPTNLGFDINIAGSHIGGPAGQGAQGGYFGPFPSNLYPNLGEFGQGAYLTNALTVKANEIIDDAVAQNQPFFINLAHYAVHAPINGQGDPQFVNNYNDGRPNVEKHYAAMIESMDASLGAVMDNLEQEGVADNTVILFMSDNGGLSNHSRAHTANSNDAWARDFHNTPLKSGKGSGYEGGTRVPMIVAWAGQNPNNQPLNADLAIQPGAVNDTPVHADDFFPTILSLADVNNPVPANELDGQDLTPLLRGDAFQRDGGLIWHYPHQWYQDIGVGLGIEPFTAIRIGDFKAIYFYGDGVIDGQGADPRWELYDLINDIGETNNLINDSLHEHEAYELSSTLVDWMTQVGAQTPVIRAANQAAPLPNVVGSPIPEPTSVLILTATGAVSLLARKRAIRP